MQALLLSAVLPGVAEELVFRGIIYRTIAAFGSVPLAIVASSALFGLGHLSSDMTGANAVFVFLYTFVAGSMSGVAYVRTGSLYAAMLAHIIADTGPSLSLALPSDAMPWVSLVLVELSCVACLPLLFAAMRLLKRGTAVSAAHS